MITPEQLVMTAMLVCVVGALVTLAASRSKTVAGWLALAFTTTSAILVLSAVTNVLRHGPSSHAAAFWSMPRYGFALRVYVDGLTSVFLLLAAVVAIPAALYSVRYMHHYSDYGVARYYPYFLLFLAAMYGLLSTTDMMWFFFIFWQLMTLPGYALIRYEHRKPENIRAANKYLWMMQVACAATMIGAQLLATDGHALSGTQNLTYDFDTVSRNLPLLLSTRPITAAIAFGLFLIGFGIKMGMWPFGQFWLPDAHPAAPSPVSAMLSGVMIKTGVYGVMRYFLWLVSAGADYPIARWGSLIAILGTVTLFTGTMQALKQEQSKRLLAFHSIGQIGYVLLGIGTCMLLMPASGAASAALAALALTGALFHALNHAMFKGLLFLNAGSMLHATGTQDLNRMGGLMKFMPLTAITALVASFSISGVPLFNGFVSKWVIYSAAIQGSARAWYLPVCAVVAMLTSMLTLASFVKFFGTGFLCRKSTLVSGHAAAGKLEVGWSMQVPQVALASLCILLGLIPALGIGLIHRALAVSQQGYGVMLGATAPAAIDGAHISIVGGAVFAPLLIAIVIVALFLFARTVSRLGESQRRSDEPWLCGYAREAECHRYIAHGFYGEIKRYFSWLGGSNHASSKVVVKGH